MTFQEGSTREISEELQGDDGAGSQGLEGIYTKGLEKDQGLKSHMDPVTTVSWWILLHE